MNRTTIILVVALHVGCAQVGGGVLELEVKPSALSDDGAEAQVRVRATTLSGTVGQGAVRLTATAGTLGAESLVLDSYGTARTTYSCAIATDPGCSGRVELKGRWTALDVPVEGSTSITLGGRSDGGAGGVGGAGGASGVGGAGGGSGAGGTSGSGGSSSGDFPGTGDTYTVTSLCGPTSTPGLRPSCCVDAGFPPAPQCGWVRVRNGSTVMVPFIIDDGGARIDVPVRFDTPARFPDVETCYAFQNAWGWVNPEDGGTGAIHYLCSSLRVERDGTWHGYASGGCVSHFNNINCDRLFDGGTAAWVETLTRMQYFDPASRSNVRQADGKTYFYTVLP